MINEIQGANPGTLIKDGDGDKSDWIELYNNSNSNIDLSIYFVSDDNTDARKWQFPTGTSLGAYQRIVIFASNKNKRILDTFHTNFRIDIDETIYLSDTSGDLIDIMEADWVQNGYSKGRQFDGDPVICYFGNPTPHQQNSNSVCSKLIAATPVFSHNSGKYNSSFNLTFTYPPQSQLYYTLDGSKPTNRSKRYYSGNILIDSSRVVRARVYKLGSLPSKIISKTFIVGQPTKLKIVSLSTDPKNLWDPANGIYNFSAARANKKVEGHAEILDEKGNTVYELDADISTQGYASANLAGKPFQVDAASYYDSSEVNYRLFPNKKISEFKGFKIRQAGTDWMNTHFKDAFCNIASRNTYNVIQDWQPCALYVNGKYWGLYDFREKQNGDFIEKNLGINSDNIGYASFESPDVSSPAYNVKKFNTIDSFYSSANPANASYLAESNKYFDYKSIVDYITTETFFGNSDWPQNNTRYFFTNLKDVPCRYILWDLDFTMENGNASISNQFPLSGSYARNITGLHRTLMKNLNYRNYFINRYCDLLNTEYLGPKLVKLANQVKDSINQEMVYASIRWTGNNTFFSGNINGDTSAWGSRFRSSIQWLGNRPNTAFANLNVHLGGTAIAKLKEITLAVNPKEAGVIKINTIVPKNPNPWKGFYFDTAYVKITAIPNPGYTFSNWSANSLMGSSSSQVINVKLTANETFTANFTGSKEKAKVAITEINYKSDLTRNAGDWIELKNYSNSSINLSEWRLEAFSPYKKFIFPLNTVIPANSYLVLVEDSSLFKIQHPGVPFLKTPIGFSFDGKGDEIMLYNNQDSLIHKINYQSDGDWPLAANGMGYTLELKNDSAKSSLPSSWFNGCIAGSPSTAFVPCSSPLLKVTELNVKSRWELDASDWVEVMNPSSSDLDLSNYKIRDDNDDYFYTIPNGSVLKAGKRMIFASDTTAFRAVYPFIASANVRPLGNIKLSSESDGVRFYNTNNKLVFGMAYGEYGSWPKKGRGDGRTLEYKDSINQQSIGFNWFSGCMGGSPMNSYTACPKDSIIITEINYQSPSYNDANDWVELNNFGKKSLNISNYKMTDGGGGMFVFPNGSNLSSNEFKVVSQKTSNFTPKYPSITPIGSFSYGLSSSSEALRIYNVNNQLVYFVKFNDSNLWHPKASATGKTIEYRSGDPSRPQNWFVGCIGGSPSKVYTPCYNDSIVVTELNLLSSVNQNTGDWLEIKNIGKSTLNLNQWKIKNSTTTYTVGGNLKIDGQSYALILQDSNNFRNYHKALPHQIKQVNGLDLKNNDTLTLFNQNGFIIKTLRYQTNANGLSDVLGTSKTLELLVDTARLPKLSQWRVGCPGGSPLNPISKCVNQLSLNEINIESDQTQQSSDWIEVMNNGKFPYFLFQSELYIDNLANVIDSAVKIEPNQLLVISSDTSVFKSYYKNKINLFEFNFSLDSSNTIVLKDTSNTPLFEVKYDVKGAWSYLPMGWGRTIQLIKDSLSNSNPTHWKIGALDGNPGVKETQYSEDTFKLIELMPLLHPNVKCGYWLEIKNTSNVDLDISNYILVNKNLNEFVIPSNTMLQSNKSIVLCQDSTLFYSVYPRSISVVPVSGNFKLDNWDKLRLLNPNRKLKWINGYGMDTTWNHLNLQPGYTYVNKENGNDDNNGHAYQTQCFLGSPSYVQNSNCNGELKLKSVMYQPLKISGQEKYLVFQNQSKFIETNKIKIDIDNQLLNLPEQALMPNQMLLLSSDSSKSKKVFNGALIIPYSGFNATSKVKLSVYNEVKNYDFSNYSNQFPETKGFGRGVVLNNQDDTLNSNWVESCYNNYSLSTNNCQYPLEVSEIMYSTKWWFRPQTWMELVNKSNHSINLSGYTLRSFNDTSKCRLSGIISAGKRAVLVENLDSFKKYHGDTIQIVGKLPYQLKNTDSMVLFDVNNNPIQVFVYSELAPWPANTNDAHSMILNETNNNNHYTYANHWKQGCMLGDPGILSVNCRTVGIEKINTNNFIKLYPNPSNGIVYIDSEAELVEVKVMNSIGVLMSKGNKSTIDLTAYPNGNYFIQVKTNNGVQLFKIVKFD